VIAVIERTERGGEVVFETAIDPALELPLATDDLVEATRGRIALGRSGLGGLQVRLWWSADAG